jgi:serine protease AprX
MESSMTKRSKPAEGVALLLLVLANGCAPGPSAPTTSVIVQGTDTGELVALVEKVGGEVTHELEIIHAVAANLTRDQYERLAASTAVRRIEPNHSVSVAAKQVDGGATVGVGIPSSSALAVGADALDLTGRGVTVAVLDTGVRSWLELRQDRAEGQRLLAQYDAIAGREIPNTSNSDDSGHGTHVTAIAVSSDASTHPGIARDAGLVAVRAFGADGEGSYADVIRGLDWVVANKDRFGIRVVNLSFSARPRSRYWEDPVNRAVMRAWQAGIVVVASAGNTGPDPMTIGVPGNVPYVITVGAMTDSHTPADPRDDRLATFSAAGPTTEFFVKPDVVAPGGHVTALMHSSATIAVAHREFHSQGRYFTMSGTSQSAAVVTGIVALMLEREPSLTPDDVKCRLMAGAHPAVTPDGTPAYTVFQQGAGLVNAHDAVSSSASGCANPGMDIQRDLDGTEHYAGPARQTDDGSYYIEGMDGSLWSGSVLWQDGIVWSDSMPWKESPLWNGSVLWQDSFLSSGSILWHDAGRWDETVLGPDSILWNDSIAVDVWVDQE